jgi:putative ABC transport system substrate-binding protein
MRLIGVLQGLTADDAQGKIRFAAFQQELLQLGWTDGHNVRFNHRWDEGNADLTRRQAAELVALAPDVILTTGGQSATRTGRSCLRSFPIQWAPAWWRVYRGRAAMQPDLCSLSIV